MGRNGRLLLEDACPWVEQALQSAPGQSPCVGGIGDGLDIKV